MGPKTRWIQTGRLAACLPLLWFSLGLGAQTQEASQAQRAGPGLVVTYVEAPAAKGAALAADLRAYARQTEMGAGRPKVTVLRELGRRNRMAVIEQWPDVSSADYAQAEGVLEGKVRADVLAPMDRRLNHPLTSAPVQAGATAFCVLLHVDVSLGKSDGLAKMVQAQGDAVRAAPGALGFEAGVQDKRANHFEIYEVWRNRAAYEAYTATAPAKDFRRQLAPLIGSPLDDRFFATVGR